MFVSYKSPSYLTDLGTLIIKYNDIITNLNNFLYYYLIFETFTPIFTNSIQIINRK